MARDPKKTRNVSRRERGFIGGNILSFLSGLAVGLLVAFIVFLRYQVVEPGSGVEPAVPAKDNQAQSEPDKPDVKFTFYDTLRDKKVNISEWMAGDRDAREEPDDKAADQVQAGEESGESVDEQEQYAALDRDAEDDVTGYVLQVGSFRDFSSADQVKAQLALLGIFADIQRVMLNEQDIRHRVRLGPYTSVNEMRDVRRRLRDNNIEFMLIELR
ncbi:MAG: SPOR domain-containing protein [Gammaproteobacteria bacterium]|nr:SPOR domain-containing protein [Gammaproteobacteria bacterium]